MAIIKALPPENQTMLIKLALKYTPATRALLGAMLEESNIAVDTDLLRKSLNPITTYKLLGINKVLPYAANWNINS